MIAHAQDHSVYVRRLREEFDAILCGTTQVRLAEILGVAHTTIGRRFEQDDRLNAWPTTQVLAVAYELRKEFPGFAAALSQFFNRDLTQTRALSAVDRAFEAGDHLLNSMRDVQSATRAGKFDKREVKDLRRHWAQTIHAMNKLLEAAEQEAERKP